MSFVGALVGAAVGTSIVMTILYKALECLVNDVEDSLVYRHYYEDLCKKHIELLDKYEEIHREVEAATESASDAEWSLGALQNGLGVLSTRVSNLEERIEKGEKV